MLENLGTSCTYIAAVFTGPGCSSFDGALMEVGPFRLQAGENAGDRPTLREIDGAWNEYSNVLFLDQPAGTGYSYINTDSYIHELNDAADYVVEFLRKFYLIFPEFENMDTYMAGESFAGQYIPYTADAILKTTEIPTQLKGLIIGNGWIDPYSQYLAYYPFAKENGVVAPGSDAEKTIKGHHDACQKRLDTVGRDSLNVHDGMCERILSSILESTVQTVDGTKLCINTYDIRLTDEHPACGMNWPPDLKEMYEYLPREDIKSAFHASKKEGGWVECNGRVGSNFYTASSKPAVQILPRLLEQIPILLFAGEQDLICNWVGIKNLIDDLEFNGAKGFEQAVEQEWYVDGDIAGSWQTARNLTFVKVANASHMVPFDLPLVTHDMLLRFTSTDMISAAGQAAKVPSRIGSETEAVISETHPNGTAIDDGDGSLAGSLELSDAQSTVKSGAESVRDTYYNIGSAAVILFLFLAVAGIFFCLRSRVRKDKLARTSMGQYEARPSTSSRKGRRSHKRGMSSMSSVKTRSSNLGEDQHELEELVKHEDFDPEAQRDDYFPMDSDRKQRRDEEVFSLGDSDEEQGGDIGRTDDR